MKKKSQKYWRGRFSELEHAQNSYGQQVFREIEPAFDKAQRQIQTEIEAWYARYAVNNQVSMEEARRQLSASELKELKWDVKEYIKAGQQNAVSGQWMKELDNASAKYHISRLEALKLRTQQSLEVAFGNETDAIDRMMREVYQSSYYHTCFEVQKGFNLGWEIGQIDERKLERLIAKPWAADGKNFSSRVWTSKANMVSDLHKQLVRNVIQGKAPDEAIKSMTKYLKDKTKNAKYQAGRLVMTEQAFISSTAQKDAFKDLDVEQYEIVATLDGHTSEICQEMDGQHFDMKDYEPGVTAPPFHVYCRSTTVPYFDDEWGRSGERAARDEEGNTYYVPSDMTYPEWKESFVDDVPNLTVAFRNDIINMGALTSDSVGATKHAKRYYKLVRTMSNDCEAISKKTGYELSFVQDVKSHLFMTKHDLGNDELEYFYPDYEISQSWQRLMNPNMEVQPQDLILLEHEHAEFLFMKRGMTQAQAHREAAKKYNYAKAVKERK